MPIRVPTNYDAVADIIADLDDMADSIQDELDLRVDKVTGKGLSTNDYSTSEKEKLAGVETGAEVNLIESVKVNGTALTITNKAVDVPVPTKTSDLTNDSDFGTYSKPSGGIPSTDMSSAVQTSLGKADTALQEHQDISGKEDESNKVTEIDENSTNTQYPGAKLLYDQLVEKQEQIDELVEENSIIKKQIPKAHISTSSTQLTDSAEALPIENVKLKGQTSQASYEGYNYFDASTAFATQIQAGIVSIDEKGQIILNGTFDVNNRSFSVVLPAGTYVGNDSSSILHLFWGSSDSLFNRSSAKTYSEETTLTGYIANGTYNNQILTPMIYTSTYDSSKAYEPYTGLQISPSPAYPQLIHKVTGDCNAKFVNRNLCSGITDMYWLNTAVNSCGYGAGTDNKGLIIPVDGGNYTISTTIVQSVRYRVACLNTLPVSSVVVPADRGVNKDNTNDTITIDTTGYKYLIINATDLTSIQIEKGSTATAYIPHAEQNAPLTLGNIEAYEGDEIQIDYVQKAGYKKVTGARKIQKIGKTILNGTETFSLTNSQPTDTSLKSVTVNIPTKKAGASTPILTTHFKLLGNHSVITSATTEGCWINGGSSDHKIGFITKETSVDNFKTWLTTHNVTVTYELATPVTTNITDSTLLAQLETLINMKTYKTITNIESTGDDLAPVLDCTYYLDNSTIRTELATINARLDLLEE